MLHSDAEELLVKIEEETTMQSDRRLGIERRSYKYSGHFPERRMNDDRRTGVERRNSDTSEDNGLDRRSTD